MIKQTLDAKMLEIASIQDKHENDLLSMQNVVGIALGNRVKNDVESDESVISVLVSQKVDTNLLCDTDKVPSKIDNIATDVVEIGDIFAGNAGLSAQGPEDEIQDSAQATTSPSLTRRMRPAMGGFNVGHFKITAGTLGTGCYDSTPFPGIPRKYYILSNNHVLANSNSASIGDPILQPGPVDGGTFPQDLIARLSRFVPIKFNSPSSQPCNFVDAAIAECNLQDVNRQPYWGGHITRVPDNFLQT